MATVFGSKDSIMYIGGPGAQSGSDAANGGGHTKAYISTAGDLDTAYNNCMGAAGAPINAKTAVTFTHLTKNLFKTDIGLGVVTGMVAYVSGTNLTTGRYEVTTRTDDDNIICSGIASTANNTDAVVNIGGALDTLQTAIGASAVLDATSYNVDCYINEDQNLSGGQILVGAEGSVASNTRLSVIGFYSSPGDMDYGGLYYGGSWGAATNLATAKWVDIDGNSLADDLIDIVDKDSITFRNLFFCDSPIANKSLVIMATDPRGISFQNCKFDDGYRGITADGLQLLVHDCYFGDTLDSACLYGVDADWPLILNNHFNIKSGIAGVVLPSRGGAFIGNIAVNGTTALALFNEGVNILNNTFYNQTVTSVVTGTAGGVSTGLVSMNNIYYVSNTSADYAIDISGDNSVALCDHDASNRTSGAFNGMEAPVNFIDLSGYTAETLFVNPSGGDFRLRFRLLGSQGPGGHRNLMGACLPDLHGPLERTRTRYAGVSHGYNLH